MYVEENGLSKNTKSNCKIPQKDLQISTHIKVSKKYFLAFFLFESKMNNQSKVKRKTIFETKYDSAKAGV